MSAETFQCSAVRDLAWAIRSPVLLDAAYYASNEGLQNKKRSNQDQTGSIIIDDHYCQQLYQQQK